MTLTQLEKTTIGFLACALVIGIFVGFVQIQSIHGKNAAMLKEIQQVAALTPREVPVKVFKDPEEREDGLKLNVNIASLDELDQIPGVGKTTAEKILAFRVQKGTISDISELLEIPGMTPKKLKKLAKHLGVTGGIDATTGERRKLNLNFASQAELETLPGVGPKLARSIMDTRAKLGSFHTLDDLQEVPGLSEATFRKFEDMIEVK